MKDFHFRKNTAYQWRRKYIRENKSGVVPTLTANMGTGGAQCSVGFRFKRIKKNNTKRMC